MTLALTPPVARAAARAPVRPDQGPPPGVPVVKALRRKVRVPAYLVPPRPIRVAFVVHVMQVAGAEVLVRETIRQLRGEIEPTVICLDAIGAIGEELQGEGVPVVCFNRRPGRDWSMARKIALEARARRLQIVHAHQYTPFFYSALARVVSGNGFKLVATEHGRHFPDVVAPARRAINRLLLAPMADVVNACCQFSARALCRTDGFPGRHIDVIENGIDLSRYPVAEPREALRARLGLAADRQYVAMVARFHPVKDHPTLLKAFARASASRPHVDLLLAGDGPGRPEAAALAAALGIADRVRFLGIRKDIPDLLSAADVFALTSVSEAASLTLMEAMAAGLPVVVTDVGGNPEIVRPGIDGLLFPRGDAAAGAAALGRMLDDQAFARSCGEAGRARALERYSLRRTVDEYARIYRRLAGRGEVR